MSTEIVNVDGVANEAVLWLFLRALRASRLMSEEDMDALTQGTPAFRLEALQEMLVREEVLTPYQLRRIKDGKPEGLVLGQYRILDELGQGGFGQVFKARHTLMNRVVALKVISPRWVTERTVRDLFVREVALTTRLNHPNVAAAYHADEVDGVLFFAMEFINGPTLERHVIEHGPLSIPLVCTLLVQAATALSYASVLGVVHRDIKPANILLPGLRDPAQGADPQRVFAKLVDFGLARAFARGTDPHATLFCAEGAVVGTPAYMAPEQALDVHNTDVRSDLYSLGCAAYFALTGRPPFIGTTTQQILMLSRDTDPAPIQSLRPDAPWLLTEIVRKLMSKDPFQRFQSPNELIDALNLPIIGCSLGTTDSGLVFDGASAERPPIPQEPTPFEGKSPPDLQGDVTAVTKTFIPENPAATAVVTVEPVVQVCHSSRLLSQLWGDWSDIVARVRRHESPDVSEGEYKALRRAVLAEAQAVSGGASSGVGGMIASAVEPWVTLRTLTESDPRTRLELGEVCHRVDIALNPSERSSGGVGRIAVLILALLPGVVAAVFFLSPAAVPPAARPLAEAVRSYQVLAIASAAASAALGAVAALWPRAGSR